MKIGHLSLFLIFAAGHAIGEDRHFGPKDGFELSPSDLQRVQVGMPAPDFALESKDGESVTLSSFKGKRNVVIVFYRGYW